ncbi:Ankyrin repeat-containing domain protein [Moelleriella libera RCEF 2490]|uniref:Ankyrin repeat-containing domain protein n=1 Tax=Moelleriella libera RCEF 2490 TaxID=1081109 RepID=A0A166P106_9HYPO|nr:Ankyrin repeat-containing domain protein [Moelleriella libera RCEF 2490]
MHCFGLEVTRKSASLAGSRGRGNATELHPAATSGDVLKIQLRLDQAAGTLAAQAKDNYGRKAMHHAAERGLAEIVGSTGQEKLREYAGSTWKNVLTLGRERKSVGCGRGPSQK